MCSLRRHHKMHDVDFSFSAFKWRNSVFRWRLTSIFGLAMASSFNWFFFLWGRFHRQSPNFCLALSHFSAPFPWSVSFLACFGLLSLEFLHGWCNADGTSKKNPAAKRTVPLGGNVVKIIWGVANEKLLSYIFGFCSAFRSFRFRIQVLTKIHK